jgi:hypothetical protein
MSTQLLLKLDDAHLTDPQDRRQIREINHVLSIQPDLVRLTVAGIWRLRPIIKRFSSDVVAFVARCLLDIPINNNVGAWLLREVMRADDDLGKLFKTRAARIEHLNSLNP